MMTGRYFTPTRKYSMLDLFQGVSVGVDDEDYSEALSPHVNLTGRLGCFIHVSHIEMQVCGFICTKKGTELYKDEAAALTKKFQAFLSNSRRAALMRARLPQCQLPPPPPPPP